MEEVRAAIDARKPDFAAYVEPQKSKADIVVQVCAAVFLKTTRRPQSFPAYSRLFPPPLLR